MPRSSLLNIPYEGTRDVAIQDTPAAWQRIHVDEDMFGAGKGRALQQLGHAIGQIGNVIGDIDQKNQMEQSDTLVRQADTQLMKDMTNLKEKYRNQDPEAAANGFDDYDKEARAITDRATQTVSGNKHAKKIFGNHAEKYYQDAWKFGFDIKTNGVRTQADKVDQDNVGQAIHSASVANSEDKLTDPETGVFATIDGAVFRKAQRYGRDPNSPLYRSEAARYKSQALEMFITNMARDNPTRAQEYKNQYDDMLHPIEKKKLDDLIRTRINSNTMPDRARAIDEGRPVPDVPNHALPPPATIIEPPKGTGKPGFYGQKKSEAGDEGGTIQLASLTSVPLKQQEGKKAEPMGQKLFEGAEKPSDLNLPSRVREIQADGGTIEFSAQTKLGPYNTPGKPIPGYHPEADSATVENYIVQQARLRGINPGTALEVFRSEGSSQWRSTVPGEPSWGPFQLYTGGGLGNDFQKDTGLDPRNPKTWRENIEYALNKVVEGGWGPWNGAKAKGITGKQGVGEGAQTIPVGASNMYKQSQIPEDYGEESSTVVGSEPAKNYGKTYATEVGERDAMTKPGSRITHSYNTYGKIRTLPPNPDLESAIEKAAKDAGVRFNITSGGQSHNHDPAKKNAPGGWTGSLRHDGGKAVDGDITDEAGKVLARSDPRRLAFLEAAAKYGAGGTGAGYMDDPLKVHIGITGASGKVGQGLGAYAGNDAERQAVARGLQGGGHDASTLFAEHGGTPSTNEPGRRVQLASASTGTMSDAPQPGYAGAQFAQVNTGYQPPPAANRGPITADTPIAELNAIIKEQRDQIRRQGWGEDAANSYENEQRRLYQKKVNEKADANKRSLEVIGNEIFGDPVSGKEPAEDWDNIKKDPDLFEAWRNLTGPQKNGFIKAIEHTNSTAAKREPTLEDYARQRIFMDMKTAEPEKFREMNFFDPVHNLPTKIAKELWSEQKSLIKKGILGDPYRAQTYKALELPGVQEQLKLADMTVTKSTGDFSPRLKSFLPFLEAEIRIHMEQNKKVPNPEEIDGMVNRILRTSSRQVTVLGFGISKPFTGKYGEAQDPLMETVRAFEVPMTKDEKDVMLKEYQEWYPNLKDIKSADDINARQQAYWRAHRKLRTEALDVYDVRTGR